MQPRILVLGRNGQLATSVRIHPLAKDFSITFAGRAECDMRDDERLKSFLEATRPDLVFNTAAYTDVEAAEAEPWAAMTLNGIAVQTVARFCERTKTPLIHVSTDYVYDGEKGVPYTEDDPMNPTTAYGYSKAVGDIAAINCGALVLRTAWLFSGHNRNFARTMMALAEQRDVVRVVADQFGNPTCSDDLAGMTLGLMKRILDGEKHPSVYLTAGEPTASWADLAEAVFVALEAMGKKRPRLERITTAEFPTKARRPHDTRFDTSRLHKAIPGLSLDWRERVIEAVKINMANASPSA